MSPGYAESRLTCIHVLTCKGVCLAVPGVINGCIVSMNRNNDSATLEQTYVLYVLVNTQSCNCKVKFVILKLKRGANDSE